MNDHDTDAQNTPPEETNGSETSSDDAGSLADTTAHIHWEGRDAASRDGSLADTEAHVTELRESED
jgi:hypothetical protein